MDTTTKKEQNTSTLISVPELAEQFGITHQALYKSLKRPSIASELKEHIFIREGKRYLDQYAVDFLKKNREKSPTVILQSNDKEKIEALENEKIILQNKLFELQEKYNQDLKEQNSRILELAENLNLITQKNKEETAEKERLIEEFNFEKEKLTNEIEEQKRNSDKEKQILADDLTSARSEIERLKNRNLFERIFNK